MTAAFSLHKTDPRFKDHTGKVFGHLTALRVSGKKGDCYAWECSCSCGKIHTVKSADLTRGNVQSCGCQVGMKPVHGMLKSRAYGSWRAMKKRCLNPRAKMYPHYGGRGIRVCKRWMSFKNFLADMGDRPDGMTLERKKTNRHYTPGNCRWATQAEQQANRQINAVLEFRGEKKILHEWALSRGINEDTLRARIRRGWSVEDALTKSVTPRRK